MNKYFYLVILFVFALMPGCSSSGISQSSAPQKSFLWEVPSDTGTVYILGSIHAASPELYPLADSIENAFDQSPNLAVEFDVNSMSDSQMLDILMNKARYPSGENLYSNIPNDLYEKADEVLEDLGADIMLFNAFEPWVVAMEIEAIQLLNYGYTSENGIDMYFLNQARTEGKNIYELESADFQIDLVDGLSEDLQIFMLESIVEDPATKKDYEQLFESWKAGDTAKMEQIVFEEDEDDPRTDLLNEKLLDERNFGMAEKIEGFLEDDENYFVVVGAAHLVGENGIINLLESRGYTVSQL